MSDKYGEDSLSEALWVEIVDFISREKAIDGALSGRLLALCLGAADATVALDVADDTLPEELLAVLAAEPADDRICENADEWDFIDPVITARGKMREPLSGDAGGISQVDIVNQMIAECKDEPELAERLRDFLEKYLK